MLYVFSINRVKFEARNQKRRIIWHTGSRTQSASECVLSVFLQIYSLCPTTIVVLAQYLSDQVHKEVHVSSHIDVQVQTCNDAPGSELRRQRQRDGGSTFKN